MVNNKILLPWEYITNKRKHICKQWYCGLYLCLLHTEIKQPCQMCQLWLTGWFFNLFLGPTWKVKKLKLIARIILCLEKYLNLRWCCENVQQCFGSFFVCESAFPYLKE